jgi:hypothetical protein
MASCGLWLGRRGLVAVVVAEDGGASGAPRTAARSPEAYGALLSDIEAREGLDCRFVLTDQLLALEPSIQQVAALRGSHLLVVRRALVDGLRVLVGAARVEPRRLALLLARLPYCQPLRRELAPLHVQLKLL